MKKKRRDGLLRDWAKVIPNSHTRSLILTRYYKVLILSRVAHIACLLDYEDIFGRRTYVVAEADISSARWGSNGDIRRAHQSRMRVTCGARSGAVWSTCTAEFHGCFLSKHSMVFSQEYDKQSANRRGALMYWIIGDTWSTELDEHASGVAMCNIWGCICFEATGADISCWV